MFQKWPKIPRIENEVYHTSEKIDGTNAAIIIKPIDLLDVEPYTDYCVFNSNGMGIWTQSRKRLITPNNDNFGFASWVRENGENLLTLGEGYHYGEWWGQGIQRGYGLDHKRFSLFNPEKQSTDETRGCNSLCRKSKDLLESYH